MLIFGLLALALADHISAQTPRGPVCEFPDISTLSPVTMQSGAAPAAGTGGDLPGGRWELTALRYNSAVPIAGDALGAVELDALTAATGTAGLALEVNITAPVANQTSEAGAGPYAAVGNVLNFTNDCGEDLTLGAAEYTVDTSGAEPVLTLWGSIEFQITDPFPVLIVIDLEAEFQLTEPQITQDPVFEDRFESTLAP